MDTSTTNSENATSDLLTLICPVFNSCASGVVRVVSVRTLFVSVKPSLHIALYYLSKDPAVDRVRLRVE